PAELAQSLRKSSDPLTFSRRRSGPQVPDGRQLPRLLRARRERPRRRAAEERDERAPVHCLVAPVLHSSADRIARAETLALRDLNSANVGSGSTAVEMLPVALSVMSASPQKRTGERLPQHVCFGRAWAPERRARALLTQSQSY